MPPTDYGTRVEAIPGTPSPYGLLSAATVLDAAPHELLGIEWEPMSCAAALTTDHCSDDPEFDPTKTFSSGGGTSTAEPVTVYYGRKCSPMGQDFTEAATYARAGLAIGEPAALEGWFQTNVLSPAATDLTPAGGAVSAAQAFSLLEGFLALEYGGVGVIHSPVSLASIFGAAGVLLDKGTRRETWAGNLVALGAGYEINSGPDVAPDDTFWVYITGPVTVRREAVDTPATGDRDALDVTLNDRYVLAERTSVVAYECVVGAVQVIRTVGGNANGPGDAGTDSIDGGSP